MSQVLIVDDSASIRQLASFTLKSNGFQTTEAHDGQDALSKATTDKYDLIITDRNMPNLDGIELTKELRANSDYKFTPILMLTTESEKEKKMEGKNAGVTGWIVKPFNPDTLLSVIKKVLN
jgi:two-component system chemotaxis response regulator CheY